MAPLREQKGGIYRFDDFRLDAPNRRLLRGGRPVALPSKAFDLLLALVESNGRLVGKDELFERVWPDQIVEESNLTVHVSAIRKALGESKSNPHYVFTVPGHGYRFAAEVQHLDEEDELVIETQTLSRIVIERETEENGNESANDKTLNEAAAARPRETQMPAASVWKLKHKSSLRRVLWGVILSMGIGLTGVLWWSSHTRKPSAGASPPARIKSIAVLPFQPLDPNGRDESLEIGLTEMLINRLSGISQISVRPLSAVRGFDASSEGALAFGRRLQVEILLIGNVKKTDERLRGNVRLLRVANGETLWEGIFEEDFSNIQALEEKFTTRVVELLEITPSIAEQERLAKRPTANTEAYKAYIVGRYRWNKRDGESLKKSLENFREAIDLDPLFALAYAGRADSYIMLGLYGDLAPREAMSLARGAANSALEIDPELAEASASLALADYLFIYDWANAERGFRRAIELKPNYATTHHWFGLYLAMTERREEAQAELKIAQELDPLSMSIRTDIAFAHYLARHYEKAVAALNETLELDPNFANAHYHLGLNYIQQKRFDAAMAEFERVKQLTDGKQGEIEQAWVLAFAGKRAEAERIFKGLEARKKALSPVYVAGFYAAASDSKRALAHLREAYEKRDPFLVALKVDPIFDALRQDREFLDLLNEMSIAN
jgi:DNA-binding winged helix-turn-helix (wHTH) protein/TolB-like protein/Tfp pilus assembly protein PilF